MRSGRIELVTDDIAVKLDELADLSEFWKKNRHKGRNPQGIRMGMIYLCNEIVALTNNKGPEGPC